MASTDAVTYARYMVRLAGFVMPVLVIAGVVGCKDKSECAPIVVNGSAYELCSKTAAPPELAKAAQELAQADNVANQAVNVAKLASEQVEALQRDLMDLDRKVTAATDAITSAQTDSDRASAKAKLAELQRDKAAFDARAAAAKAAAENAARRSHGPHNPQISPECVDNPLAKGCT